MIKDDADMMTIIVLCIDGVWEDDDEGDKRNCMRNKDCCWTPADLLLFSLLH